jgi:hypothetical protein
MVDGGKKTTNSGRRLPYFRQSSLERARDLSVATRRAFQMHVFQWNAFLLGERLDVGRHSGEFTLRQIQSWHAAPGFHLLRILDPPR